MILRTLFLVLVVFAAFPVYSQSFESSREASLVCFRDKHSLNTLDQLLEAYIYLVEAGDRLGAATCQSKIRLRVKEQMISPETQSVQMSFDKINNYSQTHPLPICDLGIAMQTDWENAFLPKQRRRATIQYSTNHAPLKGAFAFLSFMAFGRGAKAAFQNIAALETRMYGLYALAMTTVGGTFAASSIDDAQERYSEEAELLRIGIPPSPAELVNCPAVGTLSNHIESLSLEEVEEELKREATKLNIESVSLIASSLLVSRYVRLAGLTRQLFRISKGIRTGAAFVTGAMRLAAVSGPQILASAAIIGSVEAAGAYSNRRHRINREEAVNDAISDHNSIFIAVGPQGLLADVPTEERLIYSNQYFHNEAYLKTREVIAATYDLVGYHNRSLMERVLAYSDRSVKNFGKYETGEQSYERTTQRFEKDTQRFLSDTRKLFKPDLKCTVQNSVTKRQESVHEFLIRENWISLLKKPISAQNLADELSIDMNPAISSGYTGIVMNERQYEANMTRPFLNFFGSINDNFKDLVLDTDVFLQSNENRYSLISFLERANIEAKRQWSAKFQLGIICRSPRSLLFQLHAYLENYSNKFSQAFGVEKDGNIISSLSEKVRNDFDHEVILPEQYAFEFEQDLEGSFNEGENQ